MPAISDLGFGEQLFVWSLRRWLSRPADWAVVGPVVARSCGGHGAAAAAALHEIIVAIDGADGRRFACHHLPVAKVSPDEFRLLALLARCRIGDRAAARAIAGALVQPHGVARLLRACTDLVRCFAAADRSHRPVRRLSIAAGTIH